MPLGGCRVGPASLASVVFTEVVGATGLRQRPGEEAADRLQQAHDWLLADAVAGRFAAPARAPGLGRA